MNINNLAQKTNWVGGSAKFKKVPFYLTSLNIPGMDFGNIESGARHSAPINFASDTISFHILAIDMLIDEDFLIYDEFMKVINEHISVDNGTFSNIDFDFFIDISNNKGNHLFTIEFYGCHLESISDIFLDTQDESTEHELNIEIKYDYFKYNRTKFKK